MIDAIITSVVNILLLLAGSTLLGTAFSDWRVGIGAALLALFVGAKKNK